MKRSRLLAIHVDSPVVNTLDCVEGTWECVRVDAEGKQPRVHDMPTQCGDPKGVDAQVRRPPRAGVAKCGGGVGACGPSGGEVDSEPWRKTTGGGHRGSNAMPDPLEPETPR